MARCPDCSWGPWANRLSSGTGKCQKCDGRGRVSYGIVDALTLELGTDEDGLSECTECDGDGECSTCDGTGEVDDEDD